MKYQIVVIVFGLAYLAVANPTARVEEKIWDNLDQSELINVLIKFRRADVKSAWDRFYALKLTTRDAILNAQHAILKNQADVVQADVTALLERARLAGKTHRLDQLWVSNELIVRDVDRETIEMLSNHPDVESLNAEFFIPLEQVEEGESFDIRDFNTTNENVWSVTNVQAPGAWARGNTGQNVYVGIIDTGVRHSHSHLTRRYRGHRPGRTHHHNWFAPNNNAPIPSDTNGHGTHCIGSVLGNEGIGVAPGAYWTACRGCGQLFCSNMDLLSCGQFMACPTHTDGSNAQCSEAPHIVNNSWGGAGGSTFYEDVLRAWFNADILGVFALGNSGTACNTAGSPGDQPLAFGVGSITEQNTLSTFSSVGPGPNNSVKPEVAAPGTAVISASHLSDTGLRTLSGTSMAAPHVAGAAALILSAHPNINRAGIIQRLIGTALPHSSGGRTCGDRPEGVRPNNHVGYGRINANAASA